MIGPTTVRLLDSVSWVLDCRDCLAVATVTCSKTVTVQSDGASAESTMLAGVPGLRGYLVPSRLVGKVTRVAGANPAATFLPLQSTPGTRYTSSRAIRHCRQCSRYESSV